MTPGRPAGLVERIGAEADRRVDERVSQYQLTGQPAAGGAGRRDAWPRPAARPGSPVSWQPGSGANAGFPAEVYRVLVGQNPAKPH